MKSLLTLLCLILFLVPIPVHAQEAPVCEPDLTEITTLFEEAQAALEDADLDTALEALRAIRIELSLIDSQCLGLDFEGDSQEVSDPVEVPAGLYRITATTEGYLIIHAILIDGECGEGTGSRLSESLFNVGAGEGNEGAEIIFTSNGCTVLWETSNVTTPYAITWEKIK